MSLTTARILAVFSVGVPAINLASSAGFKAADTKSIYLPIAASVSRSSVGSSAISTIPASTKAFNKSAAGLSPFIKSFKEATPASKPNEHISDDKSIIIVYNDSNIVITICFKDISIAAVKFIVGIFGNKSMLKEIIGPGKTGEHEIKNFKRSIIETLLSILSNNSFEKSVSRSDAKPESILTDGDNMESTASTFFLLAS